MIPIVFAAKAVRPQMMWTIPNTAATFLMTTMIRMRVIMKTTVMVDDDFGI